MIAASWNEFRVLVDEFREVCPHCGDHLCPYDYRRTVCENCGYMIGAHDDGLRERREVYKEKRAGTYRSRFRPRVENPTQ